jgi:DNA-binding HxlR family transcriptional regulator
LKPRHPFLSEECRPIHEILSRIGDKWSVLVVSLLGGGPLRFNELRRQIHGISQKMLTATLRTLERDGFVTRTVFPTTPPTVSYELTDLGRELLVPVKALADWARKNQERLEAARRRFDAKRASRAPLGQVSAGRAA